MSWARLAELFVASATLTVESANFVACLGTTAIVYTVCVSNGATVFDSTLAWDPIS